MCSRNPVGDIWVVFSVMAESMIAMGIMLGTSLATSEHESWNASGSEFSEALIEANQNLSAEHVEFLHLLYLAPSYEWDERTQEVEIFCPVARVNARPQPW